SRSGRPSAPSPTSDPEDSCPSPRTISWNLRRGSMSPPAAHSPDSRLDLESVEPAPTVGRLVRVTSLTRGSWALLAARVGGAISLVRSSGPQAPREPWPKPRTTLAGHTDTVFAVAFAPDGQTLASASADATVMCWDAKRGRIAGDILEHPG